MSNDFQHGPLTGVRILDFAGRAEFKADPRFRRLAGRVGHIEILYGLIEEEAPNVEVLREVGYSTTEIEAMIRDGITTAGPVMPFAATPAVPGADISARLRTSRV